MTAPELPNAPEADAVGAPVEQPVRPLAWLHTVRVLNGAPGELDEALSFAPDNFPLGEAGLFESLSVLPLYGPAAIDAAVAAERERWRALLIDVSKQTRHPDYDWPACLQRDVDEALKA